MKVNPNSLKTILTSGGISVVLGSAGYLGFLHKWEDGGKTKNVVYADKLANNIPTACNGITKHVSPVPVVVGDYWSDEKCEQIAKLVAEKGQIKLADCITGYVTQNAFDALSSHAHNFGVAATCASRAMGLINSGRLEEGCKSLSKRADGSPNWSYLTQPDGSSKFVQGLYNRRLEETALCLKPDGPR